jgi:hypothetical protein
MLLNKTGDLKKLYQPIIDSLEKLEVELNCVKSSANDVPCNGINNFALANKYG